MVSVGRPNLAAKRASSTAVLARVVVVVEVGREVLSAERTAAAVVPSAASCLRKGGRGRGRYAQLHLLSHHRCHVPAHRHPRTWMNEYAGVNDQFVTTCRAPKRGEGGR
jgi:hypothetical protein